MLSKTWQNGYNKAVDIRAELEEISTVKKKLKVEIPAETALKEFNQVADEYKKHARLPGFRPGKAPVELIKRRFQKNIRNDVVQKLVPESYDQAVREKGVEPLSRPNLENLTFQEGESLVYEAYFEIRPDITLSDYQDLEVKTEVKVITDEAIQERLEQLRDTQAQLVSVEDRALQDGDYAVIDLQGEYVLEGGHKTHQHEPIKDENVVTRVGDEHTHQAFNVALRGTTIGEEKKFQVDYPPDYPEKHLAGHQVAFTIQVTDVKKKVLPELNDEFAKDLGEHDTLEQLRVRIREDLEKERENNQAKELKEELVEQLIERTSFEVPDVLVEERIDDKIRGLAYNLTAQGVDPSKANIDWSKARGEVRAEAEKEVRTNMILLEIARREAIEVSSEELDGEVRRLASSMNQPQEKVRQYFQEESRIKGLREQIARQKVLDVLLERASR